MSAGTEVPPRREKSSLASVSWPLGEAEAKQGTLSPTMRPELPLTLLQAPGSFRSPRGSSWSPLASAPLTGPQAGCVPELGPRRKQAVLEMGMALAGPAAGSPKRLPGSPHWAEGGKWPCSLAPP